jgi:hypothetical protein
MLNKIFKTELSIISLILFFSLIAEKTNAQENYIGNNKNYYQSRSYQGYNNYQAGNQYYRPVYYYQNSYGYDRNAGIYYNYPRLNSNLTNSRRVRQQQYYDNSGQINSNISDSNNKNNENTYPIYFRY